MIIITKDEHLVVDSRIVAEQLDIDHDNLVANIKKYSTELESLGISLFETEKIQSASRGRPSAIYYLNEDQAIFLMTLSRNTEQVVKCKLNLTKAFSEARRPKTQLTQGELMVQMGQYMIAQENMSRELAEFKASTTQQLALSDTRQTSIETEVSALKAALLDLRSTVADYKAGTLTQTPRNMLNELVQKLGTVLALKEGKSIADAIRQVWAGISLRMRNSSLHFDLEARLSHAKRTYNQALANWKANGSPRGSRPKEPTRPDLLEASGLLTDALDAGIGLAQAV